MLSTDEKLHILIVEDSQEDREVYKRLLGQAVNSMYDFTEAETAEEGLECISKRRPAGILLDYNLPDMDGLEFLCTLKTFEQPNIAVIMLTGQGNESIAVQALKNGAHDYLVKGDISADNLQITIRNAIEKQNLQLEIDKKNRKLASSYKELEQFAYVVSHDLKAPLRQIQAFGGLLKKTAVGKLDPKECEKLDRIIETGKRMDHLITELLSLSRAASDTYTFVDIDTGDIVQQVLSDLESAISEADVVTELSGLSRITADPVQMRQLFQNLISNAIKFHAPAQPRVRIAMHSDADYHYFSVADNGIGIEPKYQDRIFSAFERLHTSSEYPGSGLGLAICRKITRRHGGKIWVESAPGEGTTFHFTISRQIVVIQNHSKG